jgi:hypothetical protein
MSKDKTGNRSCSPRFPGDEKFADFGSRRRRTPGIISLGGRFNTADIERLMAEPVMHTKVVHVVVDQQPAYLSEGNTGYPASYDNDEVVILTGPRYADLVAAWGSAPDSDPEADARLMLDRVRL